MNIHAFGDVKLANTSLTCPSVLTIVAFRFHRRFHGDWDYFQETKCMLNNMRRLYRLSVSDLTMCFSQVNALVDFGNASTFRRACLSMMARAPMTHDSQTNIQAPLASLPFILFEQNVLMDYQPRRISWNFIDEIYFNVSSFVVNFGFLGCGCGSVIIG